MIIKILGYKIEINKNHNSNPELEKIQNKYIEEQGKKIDLHFPQQSRYINIKKALTDMLDGVHSDDSIKYAKKVNKIIDRYSVKSDEYYLKKILDYIDKKENK